MSSQVDTIIADQDEAIAKYQELFAAIEALIKQGATIQTPEDPSYSICSECGRKSMVLEPGQPCDAMLDNLTGCTGRLSLAGGAPEIDTVSLLSLLSLLSLSTARNMADMLRQNGLTSVTLSLGQLTRRATGASKP